MHYKEPIAKLIATAKPSFWRSLPSPPSSLRSPAPHFEGPPDLLHVSAAYFFKYVVAATTGWLRQPSLPVRFRSPVQHCPVRYSLTCFCTAKVHRTFSCRKQPPDLLVSSQPPKSPI